MATVKKTKKMKKTKELVFFFTFLHFVLNKEYNYSMENEYKIRFKLEKRQKKEHKS